VTIAPQGSHEYIESAQSRIVRTVWKIDPVYPGARTAPSARLVGNFGAGNSFPRLEAFFLGVRTIAASSRDLTIVGVVQPP